MSAKNARLLSRFAKQTQRDLSALKRWYDSLTSPQRDDAVKMMRRAIGEKGADSNGR